MAFTTVTKETKVVTNETPVKKATIKLYSNGETALNLVARNLLGMEKGTEYPLIFQIDESKNLVRFKIDQKGETKSRNGVFTINRVVSQTILEWYKKDVIPSPRANNRELTAVFVEIKKRSDGYVYLTKPKEEVTLAEPTK